MTNYRPGFWFRGDYEPMLDAAAQREVTDTVERAAKTIHAFDRAKEPYGVEIELVEPRVNRQDVSLAEFCRQMIETLTAPRKSTGGRRCPLRWLTQIHATMRYSTDQVGSRLTLQSNPDPQVQPAGPLLVDVQEQLSADIEGASTWAKVVQALSAHPLARAGAEYAVAIDLPRPATTERADAIEISSGFVQTIERFLPANEDQQSVIPEFWLNFPISDDDAEPMARLRIWRLGVMQIAPTKRIA
jgi:hypothetical protein